MTITLTSDDSRREPRHRTLKGGRIVCPEASINYDCRIRNMSESGAKIEIDQWCSFPKTVVVEVGRNELVEARYESEIRWASAKHLGVYFVRRLNDGEDLNAASSSVH